MKMDKDGQVIMYGLMLGIVIIILALAFAGPLNTFVSDAMNTTSQFGGMDCDNSSISNFQKAGCLAVDISLPYFIGFLIILGGLVITAKYLLS